MSPENKDAVSQIYGEIVYDPNPNSDQFILEANRHHPTTKFTAEISEEKINFLDNAIFKGERFHKDSIFDIRTHFKPTETFQYTHVSSCHGPGVKKGFTKSQVLN